MSNTVTLTIAGNPAPAQDAFRKVGDSSQEMGRRVKETGDSFDSAAERTDALDTRAMGFRDTLTGLQDTTKGLKAVTAGNWGFESLLTLGAGIGDLASGFTNFLIPATKAFTAAKWLENAAFLASPLTWIIAGVVLLVAAVVLIATKTDWFQKIWRVSWSWIKNAAANTWEFIKKIPGWIGDAFKAIANFITWPFRTAFNFIADAWNNTIGRLSWSVPGWVPVIGGSSISVPHIPKFHSGGVVPGIPGSEQLAVLQAGERVSSAAGSSGGDMVHVTVKIDRDTLLDIIAKGNRRGGPSFA